MITRRALFGVGAGLVAAVKIPGIALARALKPAQSLSSRPGWLLCDGRAVPRARYPELATLMDKLGIKSSGDEAATFNLPDARYALGKYGPGSHPGIEHYVKAETDDEAPAGSIYIDLDTR